jgi:hypothetical protein
VRQVRSNVLAGSMNNEIAGNLQSYRNEAFGSPPDGWSDLDGYAFVAEWEDRYWHG